MKKRVRNVLIIVRQLKIGGGAEKIASQLGTGLHEKGYDVTFLLFYDTKPTYEFKGKTICLNETLRTNIFSKTNKLFLRAKKIAQVCKEKKIDIVISFLHDANFPNILSKTIYKNKAKIVVSERNNPLQQNKLFQKLIKLLYPKAGLVVSCSKHIECILQEQFGLTNTTTIYNFKEISLIKKLAKRNILPKHKKLFNKQPIFLNIARFDEQKNHVQLVRSFKLVVEKVPEAKLLVIGEGKLKEKTLKEIKSLGLTKNVFLIGQIKNVYPYIRLSDALIISSSWEGMPNVLLEALALNTRVISTDCVSGPREIMAPELALEEEINYPYYSQYGVLTEVLKTKEEEKMLAKVIKEYTKICSTQGEQMMKQFDTKNILKQWEKKSIQND